MKALATAKSSEASQAPLPPAKGLQTETGKLVRSILAALDDSKAEQVISIDLNGKTSIADVMLIASGRSGVHVGAIAERVVKTCKEAGIASPRVEGLPHCDWVLVDAGDVIVHVFRPEVRQFYNLEKMWGGDRPGETNLRKGERIAV